MRLGINGRTFSVDQPGGSVQTALNFSQELIDSNGTTPIVFGHKSVNKRLDEVTIDNFLYPTRSQGLGIGWELSVLPLRARQLDIDVLFCPNANGPLHNCSTSTVLCIHDVAPERGWSSKLQTAYRRLALPPAVKNADAIITVSEFSKREIVDVFDIDPKKIYVVYNGIKEVYLSDRSGDEVDLPDNYILYVGAMNPRKNIKRVLSAYDILQKRSDINHKLILIGPDNKTVFQNVNLSTAEDVVFPGFMTDEELKYVYSNADVFVYPSLYEGFGLPPLEALACGTPVVASDRGSLPEVLVDPVPLVDPIDAGAIAKEIELLLNDDQLAEEIVRKGKEYVESLSWNRAGKELIDILKKTNNESESKP